MGIGQVGVEVQSYRQFAGRADQVLHFQVYRGEIEVARQVAGVVADGPGVGGNGIFPVFPAGLHVAPLVCGLPHFRIQLQGLPQRNHCFGQPAQPAQRFSQLVVHGRVVRTQLPGLAEVDRRLLEGLPLQADVPQVVVRINHPRVEFQRFSIGDFSQVEVLLVQMVVSQVEMQGPQEHGVPDLEEVRIAEQPQQQQGGEGQSQSFHPAVGRTLAPATDQFPHGQDRVDEDQGEERDTVAGVDEEEDDPGGIGGEEQEEKQVPPPVDQGESHAQQGQGQSQAHGESAGQAQGQQVQCAQAVPADEVLHILVAGDFVGVEQEENLAGQQGQGLARLTGDKGAGPAEPVGRDLRRLEVVPAGVPLGEVVPGNPDQFVGPDAVRVPPAVIAGDLRPGAGGDGRAAVCRGIVAEKEVDPSLGGDEHRVAALDQVTDGHRGHHQRHPKGKGQQRDKERAGEQRLEVVVRGQPAEPDHHGR